MTRSIVVVHRWAKIKVFICICVASFAGLALAWFAGSLLQEGRYFYGAMGSILVGYALDSLRRSCNEDEELNERYKNMAFLPD